MAQLSEATKKAERFSPSEKGGLYKGTINSMQSRLLLELFFSSSSLYDTNRIKKHFVPRFAHLLLVEIKRKFFGSHKRKTNSN